VAEPYYEILEGWHLQEAMNLYNLVRYFRATGIVTANAEIVPAACRIVGCIIESDQLSSAYSPLENQSIRGIKHEFVNTHGGRFHEYDLTLPMWQYEYRMLSDVVELGILAYSVSSRTCDETTTFLPLHTSGRCDALMVWLEYEFQTTKSDAASAESFSTNCMAHKQIVRMLQHRPSVLEGESKAVCKSKFGGCDDLDDDHSFDVQIIGCASTSI
jgi:hypothetical protein